MIPELVFYIYPSDDIDDTFRVTLDGDSATKARLPQSLWQRFIKNQRNIPPEDYLPFGEELFRALFATKGRRTKLNTLLENQAPFAIRLGSESHFLHDLPWELLWRPGDKKPLFLNPDVSLIRSLPESRPFIAAPAQPPYKLLIILSLPVPTYEKAPINPLSEVEKLKQALEPWLSRNLLQIEITVKANKIDLTALFAQKKFNIIHFIGHGGPGGRLVMEESPATHPEPYRFETLMQGEEAASIFKQGQPQAVILNACYTASSDSWPLGFSPGLAQSLHTAGIPLVVANQSSVEDQKAIELTRHLYGGLLGTPEKEDKNTPLSHLLSKARLYLGEEFWRPVAFIGQGLNREDLFTAPLERDISKAKILRRLLGLTERTPFYIYRFRPLREIIHKLIQEDKKVVVLHGLGGVGKSFLADYAADFLSFEFQHVLALDMRELTQGGNLTSKVATTLATEGIIESTKASEIGQLGPQAFWEELNEAMKKVPWLLVLDNFEVFQEKDDISRAGFVTDEFLREFLKVVQSARLSGRVVLTTRLVPYLDVAARLPLETVEVGPYDQGERDILIDQVHRQNPEKKRALEDFADEVGWHPLALGLWLDNAMEAKRIIKRRELKDVLEFYKDFFRAYKEEIKALLFFKEPISKEILTKIFEDEPDAEELFVKKLGIFEFFGQGEDAYYHLFPVLRLYFEHLLSENETPFIKDLLEKLKDLKPKGPLDALNLANLFEKAQGVIDAQDKKNEIESNLLDLYSNLADFFEERSQLNKAEVFYKKAIKIREEKLGKNHTDTATSYNNLAGLYRSMGRYEDAETLYKKAIKIREEKLGKNHTDTATSYNNLAGLYEDMGRYEDAETLYKKAIKIREEKLPDYHPYYFGTALALCMVSKKLGNRESFSETVCKAVTKLRHLEFQINTFKQDGRDVTTLYKRFINYAPKFIALMDEDELEALSESCQEDLRLLKGKVPIPEILMDELKRQLDL